nr:MAG TPA: hypothetical protein [Caudoviricetes sp.]
MCFVLFYITKLRFFVFMYRTLCFFCQFSVSLACECLVLV